MRELQAINLILAESLMSYVPPTAIERTITYLANQIQCLERDGCDIRVKIEALRAAKSEAESYRDAEAKAAKAKVSP